MNITVAIGKEIGVGVSQFLDKTPEIQVYANSNIHAYQWRDARKKETCDVWENESYDTRGEMRSALMNHLIDSGDLTQENKQMANY